MEIFNPPEEGPRATWRCSKVLASHNPCTSGRASRIYALFSHAPTEHISSSVKHICERIFGSQLFERQVPFFTCHLFSLAPLCLWSLLWEHQQQWELSEKDEEKNGQNLLPVVKSHSGMNFRIGILFTKNNRCPPVLLRWNFPLREM